MSDARKLTPDDVNNLLAKILLQKDTLKDRLVSPRTLLSPDHLTFLLYVLPVLNVISIILLVGLHYLLWSPKFFHKYGYMSLYSILELVQSSIEFIFTSIVHFLGKDYIEYSWCHTYFAVSNGLHFALYSWTQWIKVAQALQRVLMIYLPVRFREYINVKNFLIGAFAVLTIGITIPVLQIWGRNLKPMTMADVSARKVVLVCTFGDDGEIYTLLNELSGFVGLVFADCLPIILLGILSVMMLRKIHLQNKFRRQFQRSESNTSDTDRMLKVVAITTIFSFICILPRIIDTITMRYDFRDLVTFLEVLAIIGKSLQCISVPFTFFLFGSLSESFRKACKKILMCGNYQDK